MEVTPTVVPPVVPEPVVPPTVPPAAPVVPDAAPVVPDAAPVVPPVVEPIAPVVPDAAPVVPVSEPVNTGIPFYDNAAKLVQSAGMDPAAVLAELKETGGDITPELRATLVDKLGETNTYFLEQGLSAQLTVEREDTEAVINSVGGQKDWDAIVEWSQSNSTTLTKEQEVAYNEMLAKGGETAKLAASKIREAYMADPNTTVPVTGMLNGDAVVPPVTSIAPISRSEYTDKKKEAIRTNNAAEVKLLEARARFTMEKQPALWRPAMGRY